MICIGWLFEMENSRDIVIACGVDYLVGICMDVEKFKQWTPRFLSMEQVRGGFRETGSETLSYLLLECGVACVQRMVVEKNNLPEEFVAIYSIRDEEGEAYTLNIRSWFGFEILGVSRTRLFVCWEYLDEEKVEELTLGGPISGSIDNSVYDLWLSRFKEYAESGAWSG